MINEVPGMPNVPAFVRETSELVLGPTNDAPSVPASRTKLELLQSTELLDRETNTDIYKIADQIAVGFGLELPIEIRHASQWSGGIPATDSSTMQIVLDAKADKSDAEIAAICGHQIGLCRLWNVDQAYLATYQFLLENRSPKEDKNVFDRTLRKFELACHIFGDRHALNAAARFSKKPLETVVSQLPGSDSESRRQALQLWSEESESAEPKIDEMVRGPLSISDSDLLSQPRLESFTHALIDTILAPDWMKVDRVLSHAGSFFEYDPAEEASDHENELLECLSRSDESVEQYVCFVMLDFATADRDLMERALGHLFAIAGRLNCQAKLVELSRKELRLRKAQVEEILQGLA